MFKNAKADEIALWQAFPNNYKWPRDAGLALGINPKRVAYLCHKWSLRGIYECGTSIDLGWKTNA